MKASDGVPRCRSLSGLTIDRIACTWPSSDVEGQHPDQVARRASNARTPGCPLTSAGRADAAKSAGPAGEAAHQPLHPLAAVDGGGDGRALAAAVTVEDHVRGEHFHERLHVAAAHRSRGSGSGQLDRPAPGRPSKRGRPSSMRCRARVKIWRQLASLLATVSGDLLVVRSRTPRAAGTRPAPPATGSPAAPGTPATASRTSRRVRPGRARSRPPAAPAARSRRTTRAGPGPSAAGRWPAGWSWWPGTPGVTPPGCRPPRRARRG